MDRNCKYQRETLYHSFGLRVERPSEVRSILLLESDTRPERMTRIVLEYAAGGVIDQNESFLSANVGESQGPGDIRTDGLDLVGLAPVDVGTPGDSGGVEHVARLHGFDVVDDGLAILKPTGSVSVGDSLSFAEFAKKSADPSGSTVD